MRITVTQEHISKGENWIVWNPLCLAIKDALSLDYSPVFHQFYEVQISRQPPHPHFYVPIIVPEKVARWLIRYSEERKVKPFTFELDIPGTLLTEILEDKDER